MVTGISTYLNNSTTTTNTSTGGSDLGKDDFLKLMITQLKYQDPSDPLDSSAYSAQLAQFSSLEQLTNINTSLNNSIDANYVLTQSINNTMSATWIGKSVKLEGTTLTNSGQEEIGFGYNLPSEAKNISVKIYDKNGALVKTIENAEKSVGDHKLFWDFTDNNGVKLNNGDYTFKVEATNTAGNDITTTTFRIGTIDSIKFTSNGTILVVDDTEYNLSDITEILNPTEG
ncbi:MAG: flagellar hook capping FlgD N-terminal domain-containing protein [bacterium]